MFMPLLLVVVCIVAGVALPLLGWYTGPAWSIYTRHIPAAYPLVGAAAGGIVGLGVAIMVVG